MRALVAAVVATVSSIALAEERSYPQEVLEVSSFPRLSTSGVQGRSIVRAHGCEGLLEIYFQYEPNGPWRHEASTHFGFDALDIGSCGRWGDAAGFISCDIPASAADEENLTLLRRKLSADIVRSEKHRNREATYQRALLDAVPKGAAGQFYARNHTITHLPTADLLSEPIAFWLFAHGEDVEPALHKLREHREQYCPLQG